MSGRTRSKTEDGLPNPIDIHVGQRLRMRRTQLGMSQEKLANALGLTFQQVQKYERGVNRISASRLFELSRVLDVAVTYFFDDISEETSQQGMAEDGAAFVAPTVPRRETLELMRTFMSIERPEVRKQILALVKSLAKTEADESDAPAQLAKKAG